MEEQSAFVKDLYELYEKGEWRKILKLGQTNATEETKKYHWCWPYEQDLKDLKYELDKLGVKSLCSIGCGTGILEWCLNKCTGMEVKGVEVDEFYWTNFTTTKPFIDLKICKRRLSMNSPLNNVLSRKRDEALLFCYFNNADAFKTYIKYFYGDYVIIIGPRLNSQTKRSTPMPDTPNFENPWLWYKVCTKQFGRDKDLLVIWKSSKNARKPLIDLEFARRQVGSSFLNEVCARLPSYGLLFCYFNNPRAFKDYAKGFIGNVIVIIGPKRITPKDNQVKHSDPMPEEPGWENEKQWTKAWSKEIGNEKDICVIWKRNL